MMVTESCVYSAQAGLGAGTNSVRGEERLQLLASDPAGNSNSLGVCLESPNAALSLHCLYNVIHGTGCGM